MWLASIVTHLYSWNDMWLTSIVTHLYSWNDMWLASIATEIGPTVATADWRSDSLLLLMSTNPVSVAPTLAGSKWQDSS